MGLVLSSLDSNASADSKPASLQHPLLEHAQSGRSTQPSHATPGRPPVPSQCRSQSVFLYLSVHLTHPLIISFSFRQSSPPSSRSQCTAWTGPTHLAPFHRTLRKHRSSPSPSPLSTNTFGPRKPDTYSSPAPTPPSPPTSRTMSWVFISYHSGALKFSATGFTLRSGVWRSVGRPAVWLLCCARLFSSSLLS